MAIGAGRAGPENATSDERFVEQAGQQVIGEVGVRPLENGKVRAGLGDADGTAALRDALSAVYAKLPGDRVTLTLPSAGQKNGARPSNGKLIRARNRGGRGELTIDNGGSGDAVMALSRGGKTAVSVYVHKGKKYTVNGAPDGTYTVFFTGGTERDDKARGFGRDCAWRCPQTTSKI